MEDKKALMKYNITQDSLDDYIYLNNGSLKEIVIEEGIKKIGTRAFFNCKNLERIKFPDSLEYIGMDAFSGCENLEEIILPKNIKVLDYRAFADCKRLKRIIIPDGILQLEFGVFSGCENLEEVILPESIEKVSAQTFLNCKKLKHVVLPKSLKKLPSEFFKGCTNLNIKLDDNIEELEDEVFSNCYKLSSFPEHVSMFGNDCFKNCKSLSEVNLNNEITFLPDGMFDGCVNLSKINYLSNHELLIGKRCFRNCESLKKIPDFIWDLNKRAFENCTGLTDIDIIDEYIPFACFRGCKNIKNISNQDKIYKIESFAFSGCESLEEFNIYNLSCIPAEAFSNCKNLRKVSLNNGVRRIESRAFFNCHNLVDINWPNQIDTIRKEAFKNCKSLKEITIPANLKPFGNGAFSFMDSLETINVSPHNDIFETPDHKILINKLQQRLVLYAPGLKDKSYSIKEYNFRYDELNRSIITPISTIGQYAFAGAKNIEELTVCSCVQDIEITAFEGCENLKKLNIESIPLYSNPGFHMRKNGWYYYKSNDDSPCYLPFETVEFKGDLNMIFPNALENFTNVKKIILPKNYSFSIGEGAFKDCVILDEIDIPKNVTSINEDAFPSNTKINFENGLEVRGLIRVEYKDNLIGKAKLYTLDDGTYYIEKDGKITKITKKEIEASCSYPEFVVDDPIYYLHFMNFLIQNDLAIKPLLNGILMAYISPKNKDILLERFDKNDEFLLNVLDNSKLLDSDDKKATHLLTDAKLKNFVSKAVDKNTTHLLVDSNLKNFFNYADVLKKYNITNPILHSKILMANYDINAFERLINLDQNLLIKVIKNSNLFTPFKIMLNIEEERNSNYLAYKILNENFLESFIRMIKKYDLKDRFLQQKPIIGLANNPLMEKLFKVYDSNIKLLLESSEMISDNDFTSRQNLKDLLKLMYITGALEENPIIRQRATTFINEKMFAEFLPNGEKNKYRIFGDDIHRIFDIQNIRDDFDLEFANFFLENYKELISEEKKISGFIQRIYLNFREISRTSTSNKGFQRKLKVTIDKCKSFLSNTKFDGVTESTKDLALLIGNWYDRNEDWNNALKVYLESLNAPRNIFAEVKYDENNNPIYDRNKEHDLKEKINENYSFEWLPKQDYDNLVLGKYCSCCAHIAGAGQGIMRASMILDNCQNLVIRNEVGTIISKATIYVNKKEGYAVFNTVETSLYYKENDEKKKIYKAFLRGTKAFLKAYNENNKDNPITSINIGTNRNTILRYLEDDKHPLVDEKKAIYFGHYSLKGSGYDGDWNGNQRLVLKI